MCKLKTAQLNRTTHPCLNNNTPTGAARCAHTEGTQRQWPGIFMSQ
jgi:hypothetical protein